MTSEALGLWNIGKCDFHTKLDSTTAKRIIKAFYKSGINTFDSAYSYSDADTILYSALKEMNAKREEWKIIEKIMPSPTFTRKADNILKRLHTSYLDILLIHWPSDEDILYPALKALETLKDKGIAKEIGVSNFPLDILKKAANDFPLSYHERPLSLVWTKDWTQEKRMNIRTLAYAPFGFGSLIGNKEINSSLYFSSSPELEALKEEIKAIAIKHNTTPPAVALSWVESENPFMIIRGASKEEHSKLTPINLSDEEKTKLDSLSSSLTLLSESDNIFGHNWRKR